GGNRLPGAAQGVALAVDKLVYQSDQFDIGRPVIAPAATSLHRLEHRELFFPIAQYMLADAQRLRHFANRAQRLRRFAIVKERSRLFRHGPATRSLSI